MLSLQTRDNWAAAQVTVTVGVGVGVWTCGAASNSAVDALNDLCTWANDAARPWFGLALFSWSWARQSSTGGAILKVKNSGGVWSYAPNAAAIILLGIAAAGPVLEVVGADAAAATWAPWPDGQLPVALAGLYHDKATGQASGVGTVRPVVPVYSPWAGRVRAVVQASDLRRLPDVLQAASHPRRAWLRLSSVQLVSEYVVPPIGAGWLLLALGAVSRSRQGVGLWAVELELGGEAA